MESDLKRTDDKRKRQADITKRNIEVICRLEAIAKNGRSISDKIADGISVFCGHVSFVYVHLVWFAFWVILNTMPAFASMRIDPYPFQFLTFVVSLEAIFLSTFILISQNRQARIDDRRKQLDLQVDLLAEQENSKMLRVLDAIASKLEIELDDPDLSELQEETQPEDLLRQIEEVMARTKKECKEKPC